MVGPQPFRLSMDLVFGTHRWQLYIFWNKKKVSRRQTCECTITRCTSSAWYLRHSSDSPWFRGVNSSVVSWSKLGPFIPILFNQQDEKVTFSCWMYYNMRWVLYFSGPWFDPSILALHGFGDYIFCSILVETWSLCSFLGGGGGFVLQKYEKGSFPCLTENILVVFWFYWPVVRTHHIILVTNDRYLVHLLHFYSQYREKGTFPRQLDYSISPFFWGGTMVRPYGIRASLLRKHNNAVHTRRTCDTKKKWGEWRGSSSIVFGWSYDISILSILEYFFGGSKRGPFIPFFFFFKKLDTNEAVSFQMYYSKQ